MLDTVWTEALSVGEEALDQEHKYLFDLLAAARKAAADRNVGQVLSIFHEVTDYVDVHFGHEEEVMKGIGYPDLEEHKAEHAKLAQKAYYVINSLRHSDTLARSGEFIDFMRDWLTSHIQVSDQKYGAFLRSR